MFVIMLAIRLKWKKAYHGTLTGAFFILYAIGRIAVENYREPDSGMIAGMTKGQFYSIFLIVAGVWLPRLRIPHEADQQTRVGLNGGDQAPPGAGLAGGGRCRFLWRRGDGSGRSGFGRIGFRRGLRRAQLISPCRRASA